MQINASGELVIGVMDDIGHAAFENHYYGCTYVSSSRIDDEDELSPIHAKLQSGTSIDVRYAGRTEGDQYVCIIMESVS